MASGNGGAWVAGRITTGAVGVGNAEFAEQQRPAVLALNQLSPTS